MKRKSKILSLACMASIAVSTAALTTLAGCEYPRQYIVYHSILEREIHEYGTLRYSWTSVEWTRKCGSRWLSSTYLKVDLGEPLFLRRIDASRYKVIGQEGECEIFLDRNKNRIIKL